MTKTDIHALTNEIKDLRRALDFLASRVEDISAKLETQHAVVTAALRRNEEAEFSSVFGATEFPDNEILYEKIREAVVKAGKASTSFLQRRFGIGYSRAALMIDLLEERDVIGPYNGAKPRVVLQAASR